MTNQTGACYLVECRTGCSCCSDENHIRGPFSSQVAATAAVESYSAGPLLASQYARRGSYSIQVSSYEQLPDGRLIVDGQRVCAGFVDDNPNGSEAVYEHTGY